MVRGLPDWTRKIVIEHTGGLMGLQELAARLKSIVPWDMEGNVLIVDDFYLSSPKNWTFDTSGAGSSTAFETTITHSSTSSYKLVSGSVADAYACMQKYFYHPGDSKYALSVWIALDDAKAISQRIEIHLHFLKDDLNTYARLRYDAPAETLSILTDIDTWTVIATIDIVPDAIAFIPFRLDIDLTNLLYRTVKLGSHEYDISAYSLPQEAGTSYERSYIAIYNKALDSTGCTIYADSIVLAYNVP